MKTKYLLLALLVISRIAFGQQFTPSVLDPKLDEAREKVFTPWCDPEQNATTWHLLASTNVPVYNERKQ